MFVPAASTAWAQSGVLPSVRQRLAAVADADLRLSDTAADHILRESYDPAYGARPVERYVETVLVTELSRLLLGGDVPRVLLGDELGARGALVLRRLVLGLLLLGRLLRLRRLLGLELVAVRARSSVALERRRRRIDDESRSDSSKRHVSRKCAGEIAD